MEKLPNISFLQKLSAAEASLYDGKSKTHREKEETTIKLL